MPWIVPFIPLIVGVVGAGVAIHQTEQARKNLPDAPEIAELPPPITPESPTESDAPKAAPEEVIDMEVSKVRAQKRRRASAEKNIFALGQEDDTAVTLTKSLLGE